MCFIDLKNWGFLKKVSTKLNLYMYISDFLSRSSVFIDLLGPHHAASHLLDQWGCRKVTIGQHAWKCQWFLLSPQTWIHHQPRWPKGKDLLLHCQNNPTPLKVKIIDSLLYKLFLSKYCMCRLIHIKVSFLPLHIPGLKQNLIIFLVLT